MSSVCRTCRAIVCSLVMSCVVVAVMPVEATGALQAVFELRKATSEPDWNLHLDQPGDKLNLEIWMELKDTTANVTGYSVFLDVPPSKDNIILFDVASYTSPGMAFVQPNGTDNDPQDGDFSRAGFTMPMSGGVPIGLSGPQLLASFSVSPVAPGHVTYTFNDDGGARVWAVDLATGEQLELSSVTALVVEEIVVYAPEPGMVSMMLAGLAMVVRRRVARRTVGR